MRGEPRRVCFVETLVQTGTSDSDRRDQTRWCGRHRRRRRRKRGQIYWTQKGEDDAGLGRILACANIETPAGQSASNRTDIEVLFDGLPEPDQISELDLNNRLLYWTDRGDPPRGNTVNRAPLDVDTTGQTRPTPDVLFTHLMEGIGIAIDSEGGPHVPHGSGWSTSVYSGPSRRVGQADAALTLRETSLASLTLNYTSRRTEHVFQQTDSQDRHRRHGGHRRELGRPVSGTWTRRGRDRPRSGRGSQLAQVR